MIATATGRFLRLSPRKARLVADMIRGRNVEDALNILQFTNKRSSRPIAKLVKSAVAGANQKPGVNVDKLFVSKVLVDGGPTAKRWLARAQGRATPIRHRTAHITLHLEQAD